MRRTPTIAARYAAQRMIAITLMNFSTSRFWSGSAMGVGGFTSGTIGAPVRIEPARCSRSAASRAGPRVPVFHPLSHEVVARGDGAPRVMRLHVRHVPVVIRLPDDRA